MTALGYCQEERNKLTLWLVENTLPSLLYSSWYLVTLKTRFFLRLAKHP